MARSPYTSVAEYIRAQPPDTRRVLERVRTAIRKAIPKAEEAISYNVPTFKRSGRPVIYFAGWTDHYSIYPGGRLVETLKEDLAEYEVGKGTIRFPLASPVPVRLIQRIVKARAEAVRAA